MNKILLLKSALLALVLMYQVFIIVVRQNEFVMVVTMVCNAYIMWFIIKEQKHG